jgi:hypothetical protein
VDDGSAYDPDIFREVTVDAATFTHIARFDGRRAVSCVIEVCSPQWLARLWAVCVECVDSVVYGCDIQDVVGAPVGDFDARNSGWA